MKILITGIGMVGKSTFRRILLEELQKLNLIVHQFDADRFSETRHPADRDLLTELPKHFSPDIIYLIEDIHGPTEEAILPLSSYDLIIYLLPKPLSHLANILHRSYIWWLKGRYAWTPDKGWQGTNYPQDPNNILGISREFWSIILNKKSWIAQDLAAIKPYKHKIIET